MSKDKSRNARDSGPSGSRTKKGSNKGRLLYSRARRPAPDEGEGDSAAEDEVELTDDGDADHGIGNAMGGARDGGAGPQGQGDFSGEQTQAERREIRSHYRTIMEDLQKNKHELINPENDDLTEKLEETQNLFKSKVKMTREAAMDSQTMVMIAALGKQKAQALHTEFVVFQPAEFALTLRQFMCDQQIQEDCDDLPVLTDQHWGLLGSAVQPFFKRPPPLKFLFGAIERKPVEKVVKARQKIVEKDTGKEKTVPKQLQSADEITSQEATTREVERILAILQEHYNSAENKQQAICFFEFVMNPHSYGQTIENLFYTAFLVKDGHARVYLDEDKLPVIEPVEMEPNETEKNRDTMQRHQVVLTMTKAEYMDVIRTFNITDSLIPDRPPRPVDENERPRSSQPSSSSRNRGRPA